MTPEEPTNQPNATSKVCPVCGAPNLTDQHCKVICNNCGYTESCEDIFPVRPEKREDSGKSPE